LIGEGCHFVDLAVALLDEPVRTVQAAAIPKPQQTQALWDDFSIQLIMEGGSVATIVYTAIGDSGLAKELIEMSGGGRSAVINDFMSVDLWSGGKKTRKTTSGMDKGQKNQIDEWAAGLKAGRSPIPFEQLVNVHRACFAAIQAYTEHQPIKL
jgi:polar amino acid transport system substrate-binding protein